MGTHTVDLTGDTCLWVESVELARSTGVALWNSCLSARTGFISAVPLGEGVPRECHGCFKPRVSDLGTSPTQTPGLYSVLLLGTGQKLPHFCFLELLADKACGSKFN